MALICHVLTKWHCLVREVLLVSDWRRITQALQRFNNWCPAVLTDPSPSLPSIVTFKVASGNGPVDMEHSETGGSPHGSGASSCGGLGLAEPSSPWVQVNGEANEVA